MKIGIVCDEYKLPMFKAELDKNNLNYSVAGNLAGKTKAITVTTNNVELVRKICEKVEKYFNNRKSKNN